VRAFRQALVVLAAVFTGFVAVGVTAPADAPLSITIRPIFLRLDPLRTGRSLPQVLGLDIDVKCGSVHMHAGWPGFTLSN
jgi:hypothetical protein